MMKSNAGASESGADDQAGDVKVTLAHFEQLYEQYRRKVYSLCWRMLRNEADANVRTTKSQLHKARRRLRQLLRQGPRRRPVRPARPAVPLPQTIWAKAVDA